MNLILRWLLITYNTYRTALLSKVSQEASCSVWQQRHPQSANMKSISDFGMPGSKWNEHDKSDSSRPRETHGWGSWNVS